MAFCEIPITPLVNARVWFRTSIFSNHPAYPLPQHPTTRQPNHTGNTSPLPIPFIQHASQLTSTIQEPKNMVTIDPMKGMITSYLASPQGQEMIRDYLSSPEGQKAICEFVTTPKGREAMKQILPSILSCLYLPPDLQSAVALKLKEIH